MRENQLIVRNRCMDCKERQITLCDELKETHTSENILVRTVLFTAFIKFKAPF